MVENYLVNELFHDVSLLLKDCKLRYFIFQYCDEFNIYENKICGIFLRAHIRTFDLHQQMAQENLAACFSLSMYLPHLHKLNLYNDNKLLVFPIKDLTESSIHTYE